METSNDGINIIVGAGGETVDFGGVARAGEQGGEDVFESERDGAAGVEDGGEEFVVVDLAEAGAAVFVAGCVAVVFDVEGVDVAGAGGDVGDGVGVFVIEDVAGVVAELNRGVGDVGEDAGAELAGTGVAAVLLDEERDAVVTSGSGEGAEVCEKAFALAARGFAEGEEVRNAGGAGLGQALDVERDGVFSLEVDGGEHHHRGEAEIAALAGESGGGCGWGGDVEEGTFFVLDAPGDLVEAGAADAAEGPGEGKFRPGERHAGEREAGGRGGEGGRRGGQQGTAAQHDPLFVSDILLGVKALFLIPLLAAQLAAQSPKDWISLFNGKDLKGWTPKIKGHPVGANYANTFRVVDGYLTVGYDGYSDFNNQFGHLFYKDKFSYYRIAVEYRFIGEQAKGGPGWATRNSGIMVHGQPVETMGVDQDFPISIEVQLLGGLGKGPRTTANLCTPGTNVEREGKLFTPHCLNSSSKTFDGDQWVRAEVLVKGDEAVEHYVNGELVLSYQKPQIGGGNVSGHDPAVKQDGMLLKEGSISLQSESHPVQFRKVELLNLVGCMDRKSKSFREYYLKHDAKACR